MKKVACLIFELEPGEEVKDLISKIDNIGKRSIKVMTNELSGEVINTPGWERKFNEIMLNLGISPEFSGYHVLLNIMEYMAEDPERRKNIYMRELYAHVEKVMGKSYHRAEKNIRHVIERIYDFNEKEKIFSVLGLPDSYNRQITNSPFIAILSKAIF